ncbi:MAG: hypothetical protein KC431_31505, partial [Myxococcales bacterium]|nr:hypothetical protein [Myxococcales bacterium]
PFFDFVSLDYPEASLNVIALDHGDSVGLLYAWGNNFAGCWDEWGLPVTKLRAGNVSGSPNDELGVIDTMGVAWVFELNP